MAERYPLSPTPQLLAKLGSIVVHVEEMMSPDGHEFDRTALQQLLIDPEVVSWIGAMTNLAMVPRKRRG